MGARSWAIHIVKALVFHWEMDWNRDLIGADIPRNLSISQTRCLSSRVVAVGLAVEVISHWIYGRIGALLSFSTPWSGLAQNPHWIHSARISAVLPFLSVEIPG